MSRTTLSLETTIKTPTGIRRAQEEVALEVPYKVYLNEEPVGTALVLPQDLEAFGVGFLFGQGYLSRPEEVKEVRLCLEKRAIFVYADVKEAQPKEWVLAAGCGGTGKISRELLEGDFGPLYEAQISLDEIGALIQAVLAASSLQERTHCVHACGFWADGQLKLFFEDIGHHNALDKVIGAMLLGRISPQGALYTSGRLVADMVLKCARMGIPILVSRSSTSSLGLEIAQRAGLTLVCYARPGRVNIFNAPERIV